MYVCVCVGGGHYRVWGDLVVGIAMNDGTYLGNNAEMHHSVADNRDIPQVFFFPA